MSSQFEKVGYIMLSGSKKSVKVMLNGKVVGFVGLREVERVLREPGFAGAISMYSGPESKPKTVMRVADPSKLKIELFGE